MNLKAYVLHNQNRNTMFSAKLAMKEYKPEDYKVVAQVERDERLFNSDESFLDYAYERTNSTFRYWGENKEVKEVISDSFGKNRSTSVGDIILYNNSLYMVSSVGFTKLTAANCPYLAGYAVAE